MSEKGESLFHIHRQGYPIVEYLHEIWYDPPNVAVLALGIKQKYCDTLASVSLRTNGTSCNKLIIQSSEDTEDLNQVSSPSLDIDEITIVDLDVTRYKDMVPCMCESSRYTTKVLLLNKNLV